MSGEADTPKWDDWGSGGENRNAVVPAEEVTQPVSVSDQSTPVAPIEGGSTDLANDFAPELLEEFAEWGGRPEVFQRVAVTAVERIKRALPVAGEAELETFSSLPWGARRAISLGLAMGGGSARPASDEAVKAFAEIHPDLARRWGGQVAQKLGRAQARVTFMLQRMSDDEWNAAADTFDSLSVAPAEAIFEQLAG